MMTPSWFVLCSVLLTAVSAQHWSGHSRSDLKIVVGNDTDQVFPFLVSLQKWKNGVCGGTLIDRNTVLTARHCIDGADINSMRVVAGINNLKDSDTKGDVYQVRAFYQPKGAFQRRNDIALIQLEKNVTLSDKVNFLSVPWQMSYTVGEPVVMVGWGKATPSQTTANDQLRMAWSKVVKDATDEGLVKLEARACNGDSGSPLLKWRSEDDSWHLAGIAQSVLNNGPCIVDKPSPDAVDNYINFAAPDFWRNFKALYSALKKTRGY